MLKVRRCWAGHSKGAVFLDRLVVIDKNLKTDQRCEQGEGMARRLSIAALSQ